MKLKGMMKTGKNKNKPNKSDKFIIKSGDLEPNNNHEPGIDVDSDEIDYDDEDFDEEDDSIQLDFSKIQATDHAKFDELFQKEVEYDNDDYYHEEKSTPELKHLGSDFLLKIDKKMGKNLIKKEEKRRQRGAAERVLDEKTSFLLYKWLNTGDLEELVGLISAGKEANVYFAYSRDKTPVALKIYKKDAHSVRWMGRYIHGDPRFTKVGKTAIRIVYTWAKKEFKNLSRLAKFEINAPRPYKIRENVMMMSYIGDSNGNPAPRLKDVSDFDNIDKEIKTSMSFIEDMYTKTKLVHGDLSEFNILYHNNTQYLIDVSQAVSNVHPEALYFLVRDIKNIWKFWNKFEPNPFDMEDFYYHIIK